MDHRGRCKKWIIEGGVRNGSSRRHLNYCNGVWLTLQAEKSLCGSSPEQHCPPIPLSSTDKTTSGTSRKAMEAAAAAIGQARSPHGARGHVHPPPPQRVWPRFIMTMNYTHQPSNTYAVAVHPLNGGLPPPPNPCRSAVLNRSLIFTIHWCHKSLVLLLTYIGN